MFSFFLGEATNYCLPPRIFAESKTWRLAQASCHRQILNPTLWHTQIWVSGFRLPFSPKMKIDFQDVSIKKQQNFKVYHVYRLKRALTRRKCLQVVTVCTMQDSTHAVYFLSSRICVLSFYTCISWQVNTKHPSSCRKFLGVWCFSWLCWNGIKVLNDNNASFQGQTKLLFICLIKSEFTRHFASIVQIKCHDPERKLKTLNILTIRRLRGLMQNIGKTMLTIRR